MERSLGKGRLVYRGKTFSVRVDPVEVPSGPAVREVVVRAPAAAVLAEYQGRVAIIRQYRWAVQEWLYELPAGKVEAGESSEQAAERELLEETGIVVDGISRVASFYPTPGYSTERIDLFYGLARFVGAADPDVDEDIRLEWWNRQDVETGLANGVVGNGIALLGLVWWLSRS